jgi:hypothetical protein
MNQKLRATAVANQITRAVRSIVGGGWLRDDVILPYLISRAAMLLIIWTSMIFLEGLFPKGDAPLPFGQRLLYLATIWDADWYMSITLYGYIPSADIASIHSNLAFFPLYPYLVRFLGLLLPPLLRTEPNLFIVGVILSNIFFMSGLAVIHWLTRRLTNSAMAAQRTVLYLLVFPTSFYFSIFYTEATYLFFTLLAIGAAVTRRWLLAGLLGGAVALVRPPGVLIALVLLWQYMAERRVDGRWTWRALDYNILWAGLPLAALAGHFAFQYQLTGDFLAPVTAQQAWARDFIWPWRNLGISWPVDSEGFYILRLSQLFMFAFTGLSLIVWRWLPASLSLFSLLQLLPQWASGSFDSSIRYCAVVFPVFILLGLAGKYRAVHLALLYFFLALQTLFLAAWARSYWVV